MFRVILTSFGYFILNKSICLSCFVSDSITIFFIRKQYLWVSTLNITFPKFTFLLDDFTCVDTYRSFPLSFFSMMRKVSKYES